MRCTGRSCCSAAALLFVAGCTVRLQHAMLETPPPPPPPQILATGVSLLWHDSAHVGWSIFVAWQEEGGAGAPCHTDYVPCRAPWGGPFSIDQCVIGSTQQIVERYQRRWGLPRPVFRPCPWESVQRAWWWMGEQTLEPLLRVPCLGAPEIL